MEVRMMIFFWVSIFSPEDGDSIYFRNVGIYRRVYKAPKLRTSSSSTNHPVNKIPYQLIIC
jgi:hypothetical protein